MLDVILGVVKTCSRVVAKVNLQEIQMINQCLALAFSKGRKLIIVRAIQACQKKLCTQKHYTYLFKSYQFLAKWHICITLVDYHKNRNKTGKNPLTKAEVCACIKPYVEQSINAVNFVQFC